MKTIKDEIDRVIKEVNDIEGKIVWTEADYAWMNKDFLAMEYTSHSHKNVYKNYRPEVIVDESIPFLDNCLIFFIKRFEQRLIEGRQKYNGDDLAKLQNRFDWCRLFLTLHNHDVYMQYID